MRLARANNCVVAKQHGWKWKPRTGPHHIDLSLETRSQNFFSGLEALRLLVGPSVITLICKPQNAPVIFDCNPSLHKENIWYQYFTSNAP